MNTFSRQHLHIRAISLGSSTHPRTDSLIAGHHRTASCIYTEYNDTLLNSNTTDSINTIDTDNTLTVESSVNSINTISSENVNTENNRIFDTSKHPRSDSLNTIHVKTLSNSKSMNCLSIDNNAPAFVPISNSKSMTSLADNSIPRPSSAPNVDVHDTYMERTHKSEKKLTDFFGDKDVPFDITFKEIEHHGLKAMLQSKVPLCYFLYTLLENYCSENLFFYLETLDFEKRKFSSRSEQEDNAIYIYNTYLSKKSCLEINIDEKLHNEIQKFIMMDMTSASTDTISKCFKNARNAVIQLMEGSYDKFKNSKTFKAMKKDLKNHIYNDEDKVKAVSMLREYILKTKNVHKYNLEENPESELALSNSNHHEIVSILVHEYTKTLIGYDFNEKSVFRVKSH